MKELTIKMFTRTEGEFKTPYVEQVLEKYTLTTTSGHKLTITQLCGEKPCYSVTLWAPNGKNGGFFADSPESALRIFNGYINGTEGNIRSDLMPKSFIQCIC